MIISEGFYDIPNDDHTVFVSDNIYKMSSSLG